MKVLGLKTRDVHRAETAGWVAATHGHAVTVNPHPSDTALYYAWQSGWLSAFKNKGDE